LALGYAPWTDALTKTHRWTAQRFTALVEAVGALVEAAVQRVVVSDKRVTSAAEAKRLLAATPDSVELADKIQGVVVLAAPIVRTLARGARFTRLPWVMAVSRSLSVGMVVRTGVRELQLVASLVAGRVEQATGEPSDPARVKNVAIDLYLHPRRRPDPEDDRLRLVQLTRKWLVGGVLGRSTSKRAAKALDAAERLDDGTLARIQRAS
jgi:hypothetical protein